MSVVLLLIAALFALGATLAFQDKFLASAAVFMLCGFGYFSWGVYNTMGVADELVNQDDVTRIYTGVGLIVLGTVLFVLGWFTHVRTSMPRR